IGQLFEKSGSYFLKYEEAIQIDELNHPTQVLIKILSDDSLEIVRTGASRLKLRFILGEDVQSAIQSAHGPMALITKTNKLIHQNGKLSLDYQLFSNGELLGDYHFRLNYK
ncbi:MAG: DUF1934 domain-containing protein, partial [Streptococcaceae bacterium]|nr:DUF1934 domain-containing protein [Streptococcaceae bacterium]